MDDPIYLLHIAASAWAIVLIEVAVIVGVIGAVWGARMALDLFLDIFG